MGCVGAYPSEKKEARLTMVISMGELALVLADTMRFVRENPSGDYAICHAVWTFD